MPSKREQLEDALSRGQDKLASVDREIVIVEEQIKQLDAQKQKLLENCKEAGLPITEWSHFSGKKAEALLEGLESKANELINDINNELHPAQDSGA